ncbi:MAG: polysaccharide deacetylase family protein [Clostridia bacterium]|nr:polysaccharide deacetylase family protein [Clostridia bacterium]
MSKKKALTLALLVSFFVCAIVAFMMLRSRPASRQAGTEANTRALVSVVDNMTADDLNDALARFRLVTEEDIIGISETMPRFTGERVKLVFTGTGSAEMMQALANVLEERELSSSFFFTESELRGSQRAIETLLGHGIEIGLLYDNQGGSMAGSSGEELVSSLCSLSFLLRAGYNLIRVPVMSRETPSVTALRAATACGFSEVVVTHSEISLDDCTSADISLRLLLGVDRGDIVRVHLDGGNPEKVVTNLTALLDALASTNSRVRAQQRLAIWTTDWGLAYPIRRIDTTEEGAIFSFAGLGNRAELDDVLKTLKSLNGKGLFYVTLDEAVHKKETVREVLADGHDLGIYVPDIDSPTAEEYLTEMISCDDEIRLQFGYNNELPVYVPYDQEFNLLKAASAGGFSLATAYLFPVRPQDTRKVDDEEEIMMDILSRFDRTVNRGELVHFDLNQFIYSNEMSGKLIECFAQQRCVYPLHGYHAMINNTPKLWRYPLDDSLVISSIRNKIRRGQMRTSLMDEMISHYIGSPWLAKEDTMIDFTDQELRSIDKTGIIRNNNSEVYLTFNDADMDAFITPLLHVLKKHNAKATFFVRTETADWNPNLMRAIAEEGHALAIRADDTFTTVYTMGALTSNATDDVMRNREVAVRALQNEFKTAYDTLVKIAGDIKLRDGTPAVTTFFRPPYDEINPVGMNAVFDSGFSWSVGGAYLNIEPVEPDPLDEDAEKYWIYKENQLSEMIAATKSGAILSISYIIDEDVDLPDLIDQYLSSIGGARFVPLTNVLGQ